MPEEAPADVDPEARDMGPGPDRSADRGDQDGVEGAFPAADDERDDEGDRRVAGIGVDEDRAPPDLGAAVEGEQIGADAERLLPGDEDLCRQPAVADERAAADFDRLAARRAPQAFPRADRQAFRDQIA